MLSQKDKLPFASGPVLPGVAVMQSVNALFIWKSCWHNVYLHTFFSLSISLCLCHSVIWCDALYMLCCVRALTFG